MNWGDAVTAFGQGVVDGQENPVGVLIPVQVHQYHKFVTFWNYLADPLIIYWNKKQWDAFPPELQKAIREAANEAATFEKALCRAGMDNVSLDLLVTRFNHTMQVPHPKQFLESKGMKVSIVADDNRPAFLDATKSVYTTWIPKIGEDIYKLALNDMGHEERMLIARDPKHRGPQERGVKSRASQGRQKR
jgi:TRAP-type C4-dicarboxylate transport system substrate-binding protein